ncbi:hypothetical protein ACSF6V_20300 [Escherichia coli]|uniref:hypothetical protein n=1 Tax=Escherichia coli TaxID=562 RepID=UPI003EEC6FC0
MSRFHVENGEVVRYAHIGTGNFNEMVCLYTTMIVADGRCVSPTKYGGYLTLLKTHTAR